MSGGKLRSNVLRRQAPMLNGRLRARLAQILDLFCVRIASVM
jgi:hypothetical protein